MFKHSTLCDLLNWRATHQSDRLAYTFLANGKTEAAKLTYGELDDRVRAIAARLQSLNALGERALLLYSPGLEFIAAFIGCLYAGVIAIPAPPPDPARLKRTLPRLQAIASNARASVILTSACISEQLQQAGSRISSEFPGMDWLVTDRLSEQSAAEWQQPQIGNDTLAYLQYTSGSTSAPKGVAISHGNLMHHSACVNQAWGYAPDSVAATWLPYFHDYGLIDGIIQPLYAGIPCYVMSPLTFYMRPLRWLQIISRYRVTHSQGPNFAYKHCLNKIKPEQRATLDLSSWRTASNGAEPVLQSTVEQFIEAFASCGFRPEALYPSYGLAEATLLVATKRHGEAPNCSYLQADALEKHQIVEVPPDQKGMRTVVSCGPPIATMKVVIANPETSTGCRANEVGEIWVSDPSVALGYWQKPDDSKATFGAYLKDTGDGPFLRTGDLGFLKDGELFVTGRIKDVIIIRGRNYYPQDIELTVERSHPALRVGHGAAFAIEMDEQERLVVVQEIERSYQQSLDIDEAIAQIREAVADEHELQVYAAILIQAGTIPKTSSGKLQRGVCRQQFLEGTLNPIAARTAKSGLSRKPAISTVSVS